MSNLRYPLAALGLFMGSLPCVTWAQQAPIFEDCLKVCLSQADHCAQRQKKRKQLCRFEREALASGQKRRQNGHHYPVIGNKQVQNAIA